jgi:6-pyruvoyltetrahydropterin/6-carboxytetrahydropterin synthase
MFYITRRELFNAAHRIFREGWSDEKNLEMYGKCSNPNWHGHNYILFVTVKGEPDPYSGYVIDLKKLGSIIHEKIIGKVDHKNLNLEVDFMKGLPTSSENIARAIFQILAPEVKKHGAEMHSVKLSESENNFVEYFGE